jgi:hypothetical protein
MKRFDPVNTSRTFINSSIVKAGILLFFILFNFNPVEAQFWNFRRNLIKIDSLESVINQDRESYNKELNKSYDLSARQSSIINSLALEIDSMALVLDSLILVIKNTSKLDVALISKPNSDSSNVFCPDKTMIEHVKRLQNCCCLTDNCPNEISDGGLRVIKEGYKMAVISRTIVRGSCWDFINKVYSNAGYPSARRETVYKKKKGSKFVSPKLLQPGDWVYHINYSYHNVGHSAIFVCWKDYENKIAITLSYAGQNKSTPGKYGTYDLSGIYNIMRAKE